MTDCHGAGDADLSELIAANVVGELEDIAATLNHAPRAQARLVKIAAGISAALAHDRGEGAPTGNGGGSAVHAVSIPSPLHPERES